MQHAMTYVGAWLSSLDTGNIVMLEGISERLIGVDLRSFAQVVRSLALLLTRKRVDLFLKLLALAVLLRPQLE